jgi:hypothetical protein
MPPMSLPDKPDNPVTPGMEKSVSSLKKRIDELESLLREKETNISSVSGESVINTIQEQDEIPVLDEIISTENEGDIISNDDLDMINKIIPNDDRILEIINILDKQISNDLDALIKLLKHSIMKKIKTQLLTELADKPGQQYSLERDDENSSPVEQPRNGSDMDTDQ